VIEVGKQMMLAARTAPKAKGVDSLELVLAKRLHKETDKFR